MASITEIRSRMRSVEQTLKITNAMYLISSAKVKKARKQLSEVEPYFDRLASLNIVGGGSRDEYLNKLTAKACKFTCICGPDRGHGHR